MNISLSNEEYQALSDILTEVGMDLTKLLKDNGATHVTGTRHVISVKERDVIKRSREIKQRMSSPIKAAVKMAVGKFF